MTVAASVQASGSRMSVYAMSLWSVSRIPSSTLPRRTFRTLMGVTRGGRSDHFLRLGMGAPERVTQPPADPELQQGRVNDAEQTAATHLELHVGVELVEPAKDVEVFRDRRLRRRCPQDVALVEVWWPMSWNLARSGTDRMQARCLPLVIVRADLHSKIAFTGRETCVRTMNMLLAR